MYLLIYLLTNKHILCIEESKQILIKQISWQSEPMEENGFLYQYLLFNKFPQGIKLQL